MSSPARATPFVDGIATLLWLLREGLPPMRESLGLAPVKVYEDLPDDLRTLLPVVKISRSGGASDRPRFTTQFWCPVNVWSEKEPENEHHPEWDPHQAAFELANQTARVLFYAWENQTQTPYGCINRWRESTGFHKFDDPELPFASRQTAVYDLMIRNVRPA